MTSKVCILAAGRASRVGGDTHKALLPINDKAVISHIIEKFPLQTEFVVAVGYQSLEIAEYCQAAHPGRSFTFVEINPYEGANTGPGVSLWECRQYLQEPFYLTTSDCLVDETIPNAEVDWVGVAPTNTPAQFATVLTKCGFVDDWANKSANGFDWAYIGLAHIQSWQTFWSEINGKPLVENVDYFKNIEGMTAQPFTWRDTGTYENYMRTKFELEQGKHSCSFPKKGEITYRVNNQCVKLNGAHPLKLIRTYMLEGIAHQMDYIGEKVSSHYWVADGNVYDYPFTGEGFVSFLNFMENNVWLKTMPVGQAWRSQIKSFYESKTNRRVEDFLQSTSFSPTVINGHPAPSIDQVLARIPWDTYVFSAKPAMTHGDLNLSNILRWANNNAFTLIDLRSDFEGSIYGDVYYDLAKLMASMMINWDDIKRGEYEFRELSLNSVEYKLRHNPDLLALSAIFRVWLHEHQYNIKRVVDLAYITMLNMAPLHDEKFGKLLFAYAIQGLNNNHDITTQHIDY